MSRFTARTSKKWFLLACFALAASACTVGGEEDREDLADDKNPEVEDARIVGGTDTNINSYPWQISMQNRTGFHFCGGSILSEEWVLTANHCVDGSQANSIRVVAGFTNQSQSGEGQAVDVAEIIMYPGYTNPAVGHDAALLHLASPLDLTGPSAKAIPIISGANTGLDDPGVISTVTGWGTLSSGGSTPDTLQKVDIPLISNADAQAAYTEESLTDDQLAAGVLGVGGVDACQGDSGGPLVVRNATGDGYVLAGIVSWGYGCADAKYPGMYGRVSSFASWITDNIGQVDPQDPTDPKPGAEVLLQESGVSGARRSWSDFDIEVPAGATRLEVATSGGSGDMDLYVRHDRLPTTGRFDCRSWRSDSTESCVIDAPAAGTWWVSGRGYTEFSGVNVTARVILE